MVYLKGEKMKIEIDKNFIRKREISSIIEATIFIGLAIFAKVFELNFLIWILAIYLVFYIFIFITGIILLNKEGFRDSLIETNEQAKNILYVLRSSVLKSLIVTGLSLYFYTIFAIPSLFILSWINLGAYLVFKDKLSKVYSIKG